MLDGIKKLVTDFNIKETSFMGFTVNDYKSTIEIWERSKRFTTYSLQEYCNWKIGQLNKPDPAKAKYRCINTGSPFKDHKIGSDYANGSNFWFDYSLFPFHFVLVVEPPVPVPEPEPITLLSILINLRGIIICTSDLRTKNLLRALCNTMEQDHKLIQF